MAPSHFDPAYRLVYSATTNPPWRLWLLGLVGVPGFIVGRVWWRSLRAATPRDLTYAMLPPVVVMGISICFILGLIALPGVEYLSLAASLARGKYALVEGVVSGFTRGDADGHTDETWTVVSEGRAFHYRYNPYVIRGGYDRPSRADGPLHDGIMVRIADVDGLIARLEVAP